jgi:hypothetical protein
MAKTEAVAAPVGKKRNPADEAKLRSILMLGMQNASMIAMFTKSTDDDKACARINRALYDPMRWEVLAQIFFEDEEP